MVSAPPTSGQTGCQPGIGGHLFANGGDVEVEMLARGGDYTIELHLMSPGPQRFIAVNSEVGKIVKLGSFTAGTELVFGVFIRDTQKTFMMGSGSVNPDGLPHAEVTCFSGKRANIGFEDQSGGGDNDFDDLQFTVRQSQSCEYSISPASQSFGTSGGNGSFNLTTTSGCSWSISSNVNWITVTSGTAGSDGGRINYTVALNQNTSSRTGTINAQGQTFTVFQDGDGGQPIITSTVRSGKKVFVYGVNFDMETVILLNGEPQKTIHDDNDPSGLVIGKKLGRWAQPGDRLTVRKGSGVLSPEYVYTQ